MIDDIQALGKANQSQQEFFNTFTNLYDNSKQIVITSDRSPNDLKVLEERLQTRFSWGLPIPINPPGFDLRRDILKSKIKGAELDKDIPIPDEVIDFIASNIGSNVRELEGSINRLCVYSTVMGGAPINLALAQEALKDYVKIGDFVEVKNSTVGQGTKIPHLSYVGDSTLGERINIGCGSITCNYDGLKKHRTVIEDDVFVGSNTNLVAPVTIREGAVIGAGSTITKDVDSGTLALTRAPLKIVKSWKKR